MADFKQNYFQRRTKPKGPRSNNRITSPEIQVIGSDGENLGILNLNDAINKARDQGLDLIEIAPNAKPPVCKIMDMGKYNEIEDTREMKAKQKKLFKEKKRTLINEKQSELMKEFYKELGKTKTGDAFNRIRNAKNNTFNESYYMDVSHWNSIRGSIFPGGGYLIGEDRKWATIYDKLTERPRSNIVGCANDSDLGRYVFEN